MARDYLNWYGYDEKIYASFKVLVDHLDDKQLTDFISNAYFIVERGGVSFYICPEILTHSVSMIYEPFHFIKCHCCSPRSNLVFDDMLAIKLIIEADWRYYYTADANWDVPFLPKYSKASWSFDFIERYWGVYIKKEKSGIRIGVS